jgi:hypothetical protein
MLRDPRAVHANGIGDLREIGFLIRGHRNGRRTGRASSRIRRKPRRGTISTSGATPEMSLRLQSDPNSAHPETDQVAMSGNLCVGRVYKREFTRITQFFWAINGVQQTPPDVMRLAGVTGSFEQAQAELKENWAKWLTWAKLQEIND